MFGRENLEVLKADAPGEGMIDVMEAECVNRVMDAYEARIKELEASQPKWISVSKMLPNDDEPIGTWYIVKFSDGTEYFADWDSDLHIFTNPRCEYTSILNNVVYWCKKSMEDKED